MEDEAVTLNRFDEFVRTNTWPGDNPARSALIRVSASMLACREWFEAHGVAYTAADLVAMTRLALEYELPDPIEDINRPF
jgi:hypothetical protein